jgi:tRNA(Ile)-lysidine synthase
MATARKMPSLKQCVARFIRDECQLPEGTRLLLAVSGGVDSTCLLHLLAALREELGIKLHVAHLNHRLRGAESTADADFIRQLTVSLDISLTTDSADVRAYQKKNKISLEEAAREVRYDFLANTAASMGVGYIATGHILDDQVETIIMHIIRGTGIKGLAGLKAAAEWELNGEKFNLIRPLLEVSRSQTAAYCKKHKLNPRLDSSNLSLSPLRNRIRQQLLPLLKDYNSAIAEALLRVAAIAADETAFIDTEAVNCWKSIAEEKWDTIILDKETFNELHAAQQRQLLRLAIKKLVGSLKDIEARHIEEVMTALGKQAGKCIDLPGGLTFYIDYKKYLLGRETVGLCPYPVIGGEYILNIPGGTQLLGWWVEASVIDKDRIGHECDDFTACLDLDEIVGELKVRQRWPGDRFQPLGMKEMKKLNRFMIDEKIPRHWRSRIPVVYNSRYILWLVGYRIDDRVKVTAKTKRVLRLEFKKL